MVALAPRPEFCSICIVGSGRLDLRRLEPGGPLYLVCERCDSETEEPRPTQKPPGRRVPLLESALDILRTVHHLEWASSIDIRSVLGIPGAVEDRRRLDKFSQMLSRLARAGFLRSRQRDFREYQLTDPGKSAIGLCARDVAPALEAGGARSGQARRAG
jgi:hypothetical protein